MKIWENIAAAMILSCMFVVFFAVVFSTIVEAKTISCHRHPIYCQIIKNKTDKRSKIRINKKYAMRLSNIIYKMAIKYHIPPRVYVAILMQESGYSLKAQGCHNGLRKLTDREYEKEVDTCTEEAYDKILMMTPHNRDNQACLDSIPKLKETRICSDFGMSQIYYKTARRYNLDIAKLTTDLEYSIEAGAKVLQGFQKRYDRRELDWWTRYNASSKIKRKIYKQMVERYL